MISRLWEIDLQQINHFSVSVTQNISHLIAKLETRANQYNPHERSRIYTEEIFTKVPIINDTLDWEEHVKYILGKISKSLLELFNWR